MDSKDLDKSRGVVLYRQLASILRQHFADSLLEVGARIPTEFELSSTFGLSRGTVRKALELLEKDGLINRVPGLGTFLTAQDVRAEAIQSQRRIGLAVPYAQDQLSLNILVGVESVAKSRGYQVVFNHTNENLAQEKEDIERMRADGVAGLILFPISNREEDEAVFQLHQEKFPFVLVDRYFPGLDCSSVVSDNFWGGYRATEHLLILGHMQVAFLYHPDADFRTTSVRDRYLGYRKALEEYNIDFDPSWAVPVENQLADPEDKEHLRSYCEFLKKPGHPNAVFAVNDNTAIGLLNAALRLGMAVPAALAIVGFDNLRMTTQVPVPVTTINVHRTELGGKAAHLLIDRIEGHSSGEPVQVVLPTELVVRESCGARQRLRNSRAEISQV